MNKFIPHVAVFSLLAVPFVALACSDAEQPTLLEPSAISADVTILAAPVGGVFTEEVRYYWPDCVFVADGSSAGGWTYPNNTPTPRPGCLNAIVDESGGASVTKGQVVWQVCKTSRKGLASPKATCDIGGIWVKLQNGVKVDAQGFAMVPTFGTVHCSVSRTIGYRYVFKGGGQISGGTSTPFDVTNTATC
jgi:hypothetical protein